MDSDALRSGLVARRAVSLNIPSNGGRQNCFLSRRVMLSRQRWLLELRHLRYFVAVAEARSLKLAAEEKLHTTQPSLSRQIRDLENEVGASLFSRSSRGVELTTAGRVFLDHARVMLSQAETAIQAA